MDASILNHRTKKFAIEVIKFFQILPKSDESRIIGKQFLRCGTSAAANYRAACRARSNQEFYAKICIVVEESDEVLFWLELLQESGIVNQNQSEPIMNEALEFISIFEATKKYMKEKLSIK